MRPSSYTGQPYPTRTNPQFYQQQPVRKPPVFIQAPQSQYRAEGETIRFDAIISSPTKAKATWMHNNKSLMASSRYKSYFDGKNACLIITGISEYDQGIYTLIVENRDGFDSCNVELRLTGPKVLTTSRYSAPLRVATQANPVKYSDAQGGIDTTSYIPADELQRLESQRVRTTQPIEGPLIDSRPIVNLQAIRELELRRQQQRDKSPIDNVVVGKSLRHINNGADAVQKQLRKYKPENKQSKDISAPDKRPIVDPSVFADLERKLAQPKDDDPVVDTRPIVDPSAFRYLEKPTKKEELKGPRAVVDSSSIVNPNAFKYIERPAYPPQPALTESVVDSRPIVDPRAFHCLELPTTRPGEQSIEPEIDTRPIVNPSAFKYIEPQLRQRPIVRRTSAEATIDTSSLIDQNAFKHLERVSEVVKDSKPEIDTTPMVPPDAFKYIEPRPRVVRKKPPSPSIDTTSYVDNRPLISLEQHTEKKEDVQPGIDDTSYVPESAFEKLEQQPVRRVVLNEPAIDSRPIISPEAFRGLDKDTRPISKDVLPEIDDRSYVNPISIAKLEYKPQVMMRETEETGIAPKFLDQLNDVRAQEGDTITMSAVLVASPLPDVNWYKNNKQLDKSSRIFYFINMNTKMAVLTIKGVYHEDAGVYTLVAHNKFGEARTSATLVIAEQPSIDDRNFVPLEHIRDLELKSDTAATEENDDTLLVTKPSKADTMKVKKEKPIFKRLMQDETVPEGSTVKMCAEVSGLPTPELTLLRDSDILLESSRLKFDYEFNKSIATITIKDVSKLDNGVYTILAKNEKGVASTFARLTVLDSKDKTNVTAPVHVSLQSTKLNAQEGEDFEAIFSVQGNPIPTLSILFNGKEIYASSRTTLVHNFFERKAIVKIKSAQLCDAGRYTLRAEQLGHVETAFFDFVVEKADSILTTSRLPEHALDHLQKIKQENQIEPGVDRTCYAHDPEKLMALEKPHHIEEKPIEEKFDAPSFDGVLRPIKAIDGRQAVFKIKFKGKPLPEVVWLKDGTPVELSSRVSSVIDMSEKFAALLIKSLRFSDQGMYEIRLSNVAGQISQCATLTVLPDVKEPVDKTAYIDLSLIENLEEKAPEHDEVIAGVDSKAFVDPNKFKYLSEGNIYKLEFKEDTSAYREPQILEPLRSPVKIKELNDLILQCVVESYPLPLVRWLKDGQELAGSSRFAMNYNMITKLCTLNISDARPADSGTYRVIIKNPLGEKSCECKVEVWSDKNIDTQPFIPPEAFTSIEHHEPTKRDDITAGIDSSTYFDPNIFRNLEENRKQINAPAELESTDEPLAIRNRQRDYTVNEGDVIFLFATISGHPISQVQWFHNGSLLSASSRISMDLHMVSKTCWLQISSCTSRDKGIYNVFVSNKLGSVSAQYYVDVLQSSNIERTAYISQEAFDKLEHKNDSKQVIEPGVDSQSFVNFEKFASFERGVAEAHDIIPEIDRRSFVDVSKFIALEKKPEPVAAVEEKKDGIAPKIIMPLKDQNIEEGVSLCTLRAIVDGNPPPEIMWMKDNLPLTASSRIQSNYDVKTKIASLCISSAIISDQGMYRLLARNSSGSVESSCQLFVIKATGIDERSQLGGSVDESSVEKLRFVDEEKVAKFVLDEDKDLSVQFKILSGAAFKLELLKDGQLVQMSNRLDYFHDVANHTAIVKLRHVVAEDAGNYLFIAQNHTGRSEKHFILDVKPKIDQSRNWIVPNKDAIEALMHQPAASVDLGGNEVDTTSFLKDQSILDALEHKPQPIKETEDEPMEPPCISIPLSDLVVSEMSTAVLYARSGNKVDSVLWTVNDQQLSCSNRFHVQSKLNEHCLKIDHCTVADSGLYKLVLKNRRGSVETCAKLTVIPAMDEDPRRDIAQYAVLEETRKQTLTGSMTEDQRPPLKARSLMANKTHCSEGQFIELKILLQNGPAEQVEWYKNDAKLGQSSRYTTIYNHELSILALRMESLTVADQGKFSVELQQQFQRPIKIFVTHLFVSQSSGIDTTGNILSLEQLMALEPKISKPEDNQPAGIDSTNYIPMQNFERLEEQSVKKDLVIPGVDTTGYIPLTAFEKLEQKEPHPIDSFNPATVDYDLRLLEMLESDKSSQPLSVVECHDTLEHSCIFVGQILDQEVEEHENFKLQCSFVSSSPNCQVYWLFNNSPLDVTPRHHPRIDHSSSVISLCVSSARLSDSGIYTAIIVSEDQKSKASTCARVLVKPSKGVDAQPIVQSTYESIASEQREQELNYPKQERKSHEQGSLNQMRADESHQISVGQTSLSSQHTRAKIDAPKIEELSCDNVSIKEGDSAHFRAIVNGVNVKVTWQINGRLATGSSRFKQLSKGNQYELIILCMRQFDQGELKLTARNAGGQVQRACAVDVQLETSKKEHYESLLKFCAEHNGTSDEFSKLVKWIQQFDGKVTEDILLEGWKTISRSPNDSGNTKEGKNVSNGDAELQFVNKIRSTSVLEGNDALFTFTLNKMSSAAPCWLRGKIPIKNSKFVQIFFDGISGALLLEKVYADDEGDYHCCLEGVKCSARLHIHKSNSLV